MSEFTSEQTSKWPRHQDADHGNGNNIVPFDPNAAAAEKTEAAAKRDAKKTFTSWKLTWINRVMMDHRLEPVHRFVGIAIAQTISEKMKVSITGDRVIADRLGLSRRTVVAARLQLRELEWLAWHKPDPRKANHTKLVLTDKNVRSVEDHQISLRDQREFETSKSRREYHNV